MKRKIRAIYIDGIRGTGKSSVLKELRKHFRSNTEKDLFEINGTSLDEVDKTRIILEDNQNGLVIKKGSVMTQIFEDLMANMSMNEVQEKYRDVCISESNINQRFGSVHILLIPKQPREFVQRAQERLSEDYIENIDRICFTMKNSLSSLNLTSYLTTEIIEFEQSDRIIDVTDKVMEVLSKYDLT